MADIVERLRGLGKDLGTVANRDLMPGVRGVSAGTIAVAILEAADALDAAEAEIARLTAERDELRAKVAGLEGRIGGMRDAAWNEAIEAAALVASLQALKMPKKRTTRLGLPREPYAHEYGNLISNAIRELKR